MEERERERFSFRTDAWTYCINCRENSRAEGIREKNPALPEYLSGRFSILASRKRAARVRKSRDRCALTERVREHVGEHSFQRVPGELARVNISRDGLNDNFRAGRPRCLQHLPFHEERRNSCLAACYVLVHPAFLSPLQSAGGCRISIGRVLRKVVALGGVGVHCGTTAQDDDGLSRFRHFLPFRNYSSDLEPAVTR